MALCIIQEIQLCFSGNSNTSSGWVDRPCFLRCQKLTFMPSRGWRQCELADSRLLLEPCQGPLSPKLTNAKRLPTNINLDICKHGKMQHHGHKVEDRRMEGAERLLEWEMSGSHMLTAYCLVSRSLAKGRPMAYWLGA